MVERLKCTIMRKKSLEILNKQQIRMTEYLMRDFGKSTINRADYDKIIDRVDKIECIFYTYRNRIYKLHGLDLRNNKDIKKKREVYFNAYHTNKEYMKF